MIELTTTKLEPYVVADHPILDMLNTICTIDGQLYDFWQSANDVLSWLTTIGKIELPSHKFDHADLANCAIEFRELIQHMVVGKKKGKAFTTQQLIKLNGFLMDSSSSLEILKESSGALTLNRVHKMDSPRQLIGPLAEAAATFLLRTDFNQVRVCAHSDCTLWFLDKSKAQRRRWCSMKLCGNRHKVAKFREKQ